VFVLGVVLMPAGCVNDYADRDFDPHVERTRPADRRRTRQPREALVLCGVVSHRVCAGAHAQPPDHPAFLRAFLAASYPFVKRFTHLPQFYLGAAFGWGIPMAFAAQTGGIPPVGWILFAANVCWAVAYDTAYAMVDRDDDQKVGVKSTAILFGRRDRAMVLLFHVLTLSLLAYSGALAGLGLRYYAGLAAAFGFALYQQKLMRERTRDGCFRAFLNNNWFGAAVFTGLLLNYLSVK
jgi:4-hydroxybenzoate polyprenyltransferase